MRYLLHIDTSTDSGLVALGGDGALLASRVNEETRNHAASINDMIAGVVSDAGITLSDIDGLVVCAGPGSYTGLRIGMATAKGLCYALDKPLLLDNRLTLLAHQVQRKQGKMYKRYASLLVAREKEYFISIYNNEFTCLLEPQHITQLQLEEISKEQGKTYIISDAPEQIFADLGIPELFIDNNIKIDLNSWALGAFQKYICNDIVNLSAAEPFYLKQVYTHK